MFSDEPLWTPENVRSVRELCSTQKKETDAEAWARLTLQLTDATPQVVRMAAEAVWLAYLFPNARDATFKRERFLELWELSGASRPHSAHLNDSALQGIGYVQNPHWKIHNPLDFLLEMLERWAEQQLRALPHEPWDFIDWLDDELSQYPNRPMRHALLYLLYPDYLEQNRGALGQEENRRFIRGSTAAAGREARPRHLTRSDRSSSGSMARIDSTSSSRRSGISGRSRLLRRRLPRQRS